MNEFPGPAAVSIQYDRETSEWIMQLSIPHKYNMEWSPGHDQNCEDQNEWLRATVRGLSIHECEMKLKEPDVWVRTDY